jgi:predicted branched-subunit amino acid permease
MLKKCSYFTKIFRFDKEKFLYIAYQNTSSLFSTNRNTKKNSNSKCKNFLFGIKILLNNYIYWRLINMTKFAFRPKMYGFKFYLICSNFKFIIFIKLFIALFAAPALLGKKRIIYGACARKLNIATIKNMYPGMCHARGISISQVELGSSFSNSV